MIPMRIRAVPTLWARKAVGALRRALFVLAAMLVVPGAQAGPPPWPEAEFSYYADRSSLRRVLLDFAASFNLTLESTIALNDSVNGRFNTPSPTAFINRLGGTYGFVWFTHAGRLHISSARDIQVKPIYVPSVTSADRLRQLLASLGVLETKFGWGALPEQGTIVLSGPPAYVELVERTIRAEGAIFAQRLRSPEAQEAFQAFLQKRRPDFSRFE